MGTDSAPLTVEEGSEAILKLFDFPWTIDKSKQG